MANIESLLRIQSAAERGDPFAQFELATAFEWENYGLEQNFEKAAEWYEKASANGHLAAEINLLGQHVLGQLRTIAASSVFDRVNELAEAGDLDIVNTLGLCFQYGYGTELDYSRAASCFRRAAEGGAAMAQFNLAGFYLEGKGVPKDFDQAIHWYTRAAEQRHELSLIKLGTLYQKGIGVEVDHSRAFVLYLIAYERGSTRAANHLAFMFKKGLGVERDDSVAFQLYTDSVCRSDTPEIAENPSYRGTACYWLGHMAENGEGVSRDLRAAERWYKKGAACGQNSCIKALERLRSKLSNIRCRARKR